MGKFAVFVLFFACMCWRKPLNRILGIIFLLILNALNGLWAQVRPVRLYRSGGIYDTIRVATALNKSLAPTTRILSTGYPDPRNAPLSAKHHVVLSGPISLTIDEVDSYCGTYNGSILVHASGGTPPYTYSFDGAAYQSSALYVTDGPFDHKVAVKDATGQVVTQTVHVGNDGYGPSVYASAYTQPSACNASDATLTVQGQGGTPPYEYSMDLKNWQTTPFTGLSYGWYYVWARDARGCVGNALWFPWVGCLQIGGYLADAACGNDASFSMKATDNSRPGITFQYSIDGVNWQTDPGFSGIGPGPVTLQIKDNTGKITFFRMIVRESCPLTLQATVTDATCSHSDGQIVASAINGLAPYAFSIDGLNFQTSGTFTGLPAGTYTVWVHDANGTLQSTQVQVLDNCPTVTAATNAAYCGQNDGSITATGHGGRAPYTYSIDGIHFQTSPVFSPLAPGPYTITLKDADGFSSVTTATISNNCLQLTATSSNTTCGKANGAIQANVQGGTSPYNYSIDGGNLQGNPNFANLSANTYTLTVRDGTGAARSIPVTLTDAPGPTMMVNVHNVDCNGLGGSMTIAASGGTAPLLYSLDGSSYGQGDVFAGNAGTYTLYVKDANGCIATQSTTIGVSCLKLSLTTKDASCGQDDGQINVMASDGRPAYEYSIDGGANWQTGTVFGGLAPGDYTVFGRDADGLLSSATGHLARVCITGTVAVLDASCGQNNGTISVMASGGTSPYTYSTDGVHFQGEALLSSLAPGNYIVSIKDAQGFSGVASAQVKSIPPPSLSAIPSAASCSNNDGRIDASVTGGSAPYQFGVDQGAFEAGSAFAGLLSGSHQVTVIDARGCTDNQITVVPLDNNLTAGIPTPEPICEGKTVLLAGISNAKQFAWSPVDGLSRADILTPVASPSVTKVYSLTASTGICQTSASVTVTVNPAPQADAGVGDTVCFGASTQLHGKGGISYSWSPTDYLSDPKIPDPYAYNPQNTVTYRLSVTDGKGCQSLHPDVVTITVTSPPAVWIGNDTSILAGQPVPMDLQDVNGSGFSAFSWSPSDGLDNPAIRNPVASPAESVTYTVLASTGAGCQARGTRSVKVYSVAGIFVASAFTPNGDGHNDVLHAKPVGIRDFKYFAVFSRWGQRVFYTTDPAVGWDGRTGGQYVNGATYVWMAAGTDYRGVLIERKGTVVLVR